jgi:DNA replication protein DnaC
MLISQTLDDREIQQMRRSSPHYRGRNISRLMFSDTLIDDVGLGRIRRSDHEPTAAQMLFTLVDQRVGRTSTLLTSNIKLSAWGSYLGDAALTMAILDRMIQRATRMEIEGPSWRDKESKELNERRRADAHKRKSPHAAKTGQSAVR